MRARLRLELDAKPRHASAFLRLCAAEFSTVADVYLDVPAKLVWEVFYIGVQYHVRQDLLQRAVLKVLGERAMTEGSLGPFLASFGVIELMPQSL